jgi:glycine/serine hydroxymethyltransferase
MEICPSDKKDSPKKSLLDEVSKITVKNEKQPDFLKYCLSCEDQQARKLAKYMLRKKLNLSVSSGHTHSHQSLAVHPLISRRLARD